jgi:hypothetical protein
METQQIWDGLIIRYLKNLTEPLSNIASRYAIYPCKPRYPRFIIEDYGVGDLFTSFMKHVSNR